MIALFVVVSIFFSKTFWTANILSWVYTQTQGSSKTSLKDSKFSHLLTGIWLWVSICAVGVLILILLFFERGVIPGLMSLIGCLAIWLLVPNLLNQDREHTPKKIRSAIRHAYETQAFESIRDAYDMGMDGLPLKWWLYWYPIILLKKKF